MSEAAPPLTPREKLVLRLESLLTEPQHEYTLRLCVGKDGEILAFLVVDKHRLEIASS